MYNFGMENIVENKVIIIHEPVENENTSVFGRKIGCGKIEKFII